nr:hypothetical protein [Kibdelosporangium sp. MJ126-NF4]
MVVDDEVSSALRERRVDAAVFVASCAERMVQVFTGLRESELDRKGDIGATVGAMNSLWDAELASEAFSVHLDKVMGFVEMAPSDEELEGVREVYSAYGVLALRYALRYRVGGDIEDVIRCAHVNLTAMGQLDRNVANGHFFNEEQRIEREAVRLGYADVDTADIRQSDQAISRERLNVIRQRLAV